MLHTLHLEYNQCTKPACTNAVCKHIAAQMPACSDSQGLNAESATKLAGVTRQHNSQLQTLSKRALQIDVGDLLWALTTGGTAAKLIELGEFGMNHKGSADD